MRPNSVTSGTAFVTALLSLAVFIGTLSIVGYSVYQLTQKSMLSQLEDQITEEIVLFEQILETDGQAGLVEAINKLSTHQGLGVSVVGMYDPKGNHVAGTRDIAPDFVGWQNTTLLVGNSLYSREYRASAHRFSSATVVVGRSTAPVHASLSTLATYLKVAGLCVVIFTTLIGYVARGQVRARLQKITQALSSVAAGDMGARLPVKRSGSQLDHASRQINAHLDTLQQLMTTTRNTIQSIAHDLRSPLSRASLHLQTLQHDETLNEAQVEQLQLAQTSLEDVSHIFDTILRIGKLSSTQGYDGFQTIKITSFLNDLQELFQPIVEEHEQTIQLIHADNDCSEFSGDLRMLRQMMVNLIENAVRHAGGGATITLAASDEHGQVVLRVCDNGPGIPTHLQAQVLEPFYRQDQIRTSPGTGLGLALVAAIAQRHGAQLTLSHAHPRFCVCIAFPKQIR